MNGNSQWFHRFFSPVSKCLRSLFYFLEDLWMTRTVPMV